MILPSILIVDDEPNNFDVVEALLGDHNYELNYAANGEDANRIPGCLPSRFKFF